MQLDYRHTYAASPQRVVELLRTPEFIDDVAAHAGATSHTVDVTADHTLLTMQLPVPEKLAKFVGKSISLSQKFRFEAPAADGSVHGTVDVDVAGLPIDVAADLSLTPVGSQTQAHYSGNLNVKIPLVGRKVEDQVEPFIRGAFAGLERRAADWLAR